MPKSPICSVEGCGKLVDARGLCGTHYARWKKANLKRPCSVEGCHENLYAKSCCKRHYRRVSLHGSPLGLPPKREKKLCRIDGCERFSISLGLCQSHYYRQTKYGDPLSGNTAQGAVRKFLAFAIAYTGNECLLSPYGTDEHGRAKITLNGKSERIHRLICEAVNGPPPTPQHFACHSCGNGHRACCTPNHQYWGTPQENSADRLKHDTHMRGERHHSAILTEADVRKIRALRGMMKRKDLAEKFGISLSGLCDVLRRKNWAWLD